MNKTKIPYCTHAWNPVRFKSKDTGKRSWHCLKVSEGCANCFSERLEMGRFGGRLPFVTDSNLRLEIFLDSKELDAPRRLRNPSVIFLGDMTDVFGLWVPDSYLDHVFGVIAACPQHRFLVLTKRDVRLVDYLMQNPEARRESWARKGANGDDVIFDTIDKNYNLQNCWIGVSAENQKKWDARVGNLMRIKAPNKWVSVEPQLEEIVPKSFCPRCSGMLNGSHGQFCGTCHGETEFPGWIVQGGESGPGFRPFDDAWVPPFSRACQDWSVPFFWKQRAGVVPDRMPKTDGVFFRDTPFDLPFTEEE